jgi:hypothetical protein
MTVKAYVMLQFKLDLKYDKSDAATSSYDYEIILNCLSSCPREGQFKSESEQLFHSFRIPS